jgi:hypothetical protein
MLEKDVIKMFVLRDKIKELSELQKKTKWARKTMTPKWEWDVLKAEILKSTGRFPDRGWWDHAAAASDARLRKAEITACLNLYHELRGSEFRHGFEEYTYWYEKALEALRVELNKMPKV